MEVRRHARGNGSCTVNRHPRLSHPPWPASPPSSTISQGSRVTYSLLAACSESSESGKLDAVAIASLRASCGTLSRVSSRLNGRVAAQPSARGELCRDADDGNPYEACRCSIVHSHSPFVAVHSTASATSSSDSVSPCGGLEDARRSLPARRSLALSSRASSR